MSHVLELDRSTLQILVACAVTLDPGESRLEPMLSQLQAIKADPVCGKRCADELQGCWMLTGPTHPVYTIDPSARLVRLVAMETTASKARVEATKTQSVAFSRGRVLTGRQVTSASLYVPLDAAERAAPPRELAKTIQRAKRKLAEAVSGHLLATIDRESQVSSEGESDRRPPELRRFRFRDGSIALWLFVPDLRLGITIGAARHGDTEALNTLETRGRNELGFVMSVLARFQGPEY